MTADKISLRLDKQMLTDAQTLYYYAIVTAI